MSLKRLIMVFILTLSSVMTIFSVDQVESTRSFQPNHEQSHSKRFYIYLPSVSDFERLKSKKYALEFSLFDKNTVKLSYLDRTSVNSFVIDSTFEPGKTIINEWDLSYTFYPVKTFIGPYLRYGFRYSDLSGKKIDNILNINDTTYTELEAMFLMPYMTAGYNFSFFDFFSIGLGLGLGYAFLQDDWHEYPYRTINDSLFINGFNVTGELNIGILL